MIGKRSGTAEAERGSADNEMPAAGSTSTVPDDLAAEAARLRATAADGRDRAERGHEEARSVIGAADAEAARITEAARSRSRDIAAEAKAAGGDAEEFEERAQLIDAAVAEQGHAAEAVQLGADLEAERMQLLDGIAGVDARLAGLGAEREHAETELATARAATDVGAVTAARSRLEAIADLEEDLARQRRQAADRVQALGDGTGNTGEFGAACKAASHHYAKARDLLNRAYPDRREAVLDAAFERLQGALEGNLQRITEERTAAARREPRQIVHL
jgi:hypothetical protein